jgi:predicted RNA-binding Zn-ribbon protein involved in translation (DUF1610 family)
MKTNCDRESASEKEECLPQWSDTVSCPHCGQALEMKRICYLSNPYYCPVCGNVLLIEKKILYKTRKL